MTLFLGDFNCYEDIAVEFGQTRAFSEPYDSRDCYGSDNWIMRVLEESDVHIAWCGRHPEHWPLRRTAEVVFGYSFTLFVAIGHCNYTHPTQRPELEWKPRSVSWQTLRGELDTALMLEREPGLDWEDRALYLVELGKIITRHTGEVGT